MNGQGLTSAQCSALSRRGASPASLGPERTRRSRDHFGTDSVRSKLAPLYGQVNPSLLSREASHTLWHSIGPSTMVLFKLPTSLWAHPLCPPIYWTRYFSCSGRNGLCISGISDTDETAETGVSDRGDRRKTSELHTSGAKRAETWRGGVKWWELAIALAVASGREGERGKEDKRRGGHSRRRAPAWLKTIQLYLVESRKYKGLLDGHKVFEYTLY